MMCDKEFNLLDEPWIMVLTTSGEREEIGLKEVFSRAHEIKSLAGEMETQNASMFRLLLAIVYAVHLRKDSEGNDLIMDDETDAIEHWRSLWSRGRFNSKLFDDYLEGYRERFYLFHPERPFFQSIFDKGTEYTTAKIIGELSEGGNKSKLFAPVSGKGKQQASYAQSVRWLIHLNSFDDAALKQQDKSDGSRSTKVGWLGRIGYVCINGGNLFEMLMLNMVLVDRTGEPMKDGKAIWEEDSTRTKERVTIPIPDSPVELLTVQFRRIFLIREDGAVVGCKVIAGDLFDQSCPNIEQMTMWKKEKDTGSWIPKLHDPAKSAWRDYPSLLVKGEDRMVPGVVGWASILERNGLIDSRDVSLSVLSVQYGSMMSTIDDASSDSIEVNAKMLSELGDGWNARILDVLDRTEQCVKAYGAFRFKLFVLNGASEGEKDSIWRRVDQDKRKIYFEMDDKFRTWLSSIVPDEDDMESRMNEWLVRILRPIMISTGQKAIDNSNLRSLFVRKQESEGSSLEELRRYKNTIYKITGGQNVNI
ncbi:MAG: type I-E CRISPR-associated protein Cse1/CasA [Candidatus Methanomethylophilaceae archaeon]|nr:type I-E CRISPR-associated protein Cse1/CasA [Candidatus Methanomethylophilaceae archaeon]